MSRYQPPIAIMSFDRPAYFEKVLESLVRQTGVDIGSRAIYLFQDGGWNQFSGNRYASQDLIDQNVELFRSYLPHGTVLDSPHNLGVALNYDRAERLFFEELESEAAIFLEDDLVLSPFYIDVLDRLVELALKDARIGYVSAVGNHTLPMHEQRRRKHELTNLQQTWGFALTRRQWQANQPYLEQYLKLVRNIDYRKRSHLDIFDLYTSWGAARVFSSQDRAKYIASTLKSNLWISTVPNFGKYIGAIGLHCNEEMYAAGRFGETTLFPEAPETFDELSDEQYRALLAHQLGDVCPAPPLVRLNQELGFGVNQQGVFALGQGFHLPERWGVWAATKEPRITIEPPDSARDGNHSLLIKCRYNVPPGEREIAVAVRTDDKEAGSLRWNGTQQSLAVPIPRSNASGPMVIQFHAPTVASPKELSQGTDVRPLGLGLHSIAIAGPGQKPQHYHQRNDSHGEQAIAHPAIVPSTAQADQTLFGPERSTRSASPEILPRMTSAEIALFERLLEKASYYLEYGAGGSTVLAVRSRAKHIVSVETDGSWIERLKKHDVISKALTANRLTLRHVDLGPVKEWGVPITEAKIRNWPRYALDPFVCTDLNFDTVLVDGRFRVHSLLAIANCADDAVSVFVHDYQYRYAYTVAEKYFDTIYQVDTSAVLKKRQNINRRSLYIDVINNLFEF